MTDRSTISRRQWLTAAAAFPLAAAVGVALKRASQAAMSAEAEWAHAIATDAIANDHHGVWRLHSVEHKRGRVWVNLVAAGADGRPLYRCAAIAETVCASSRAECDLRHVLRCAMADPAVLA